MCSKKCFDKLGAKMALALALKNRKKWRREKRYYYCKICKAWHLTSQDKT